MPKPAIDKQESFKAYVIWEAALEQYWKEVPEAMLAWVPQVLETGEGRDKEKGETETDG